MLHTKAGREVVIEEPVADVADLMAVLDRRIPGLGTDLSDPIFNIAVNDEMLLHGVDARSLADGDVVEFVPTIAGGEKVTADEAATKQAQISQISQIRRACLRRQRRRYRVA